MKAYVLLKIRPGSVAEVVRNASRLDGIVEAHATFGPFDAVVTVEVDSVAKLGTLVNVELQPIPGVIETLTCLTTGEEQP